MKSTITRILWIVAVLLLAGCGQKDRSLIGISLDFPYGETRLLVQRDGEAYLFYGELPQSQVVKKDTFDIDRLFDQLQTRVKENAPAEDRPLGQPFGSVSFHYEDGNSQEYLIYDGSFAEELFETARKNIESHSPNL